MAKETAESKALAALLKKLLGAAKGDPPARREPIEQLVLGMLQWEATRKQAEVAYDDWLAGVSDLNELRVCFDHELLTGLGEDYPLGAERVRRLREAMQEVYIREYDWRMVTLEDMNKRDQREYLDTLPGMPPYAAASVMLISLGGHALPVDGKLRRLLESEGALPENLSDAEAESWLLRQIKAGEGLAAHHALQCWVDGRKDRGADPPTPSAPGVVLHVTPPAPPPTPAPKKKTASKSASKTTSSTQAKAADPGDKAPAKKSSKAAKTTKTTKASGAAPRKRVSKKK
ncbi:MAG: hypothetical protein AAF288_03675 [Planctomycetota bacterium]